MNALPAPPWRLAVYFAPPPGHALWLAGCAWLGRDPARHDDPGGAPPLRSHPWRYGFHATLKPPLRLRAPHRPDDFHAAVAALAARHAAFEMPPLEVAWPDDFMALQPRDALAPTHPLRMLADACVTELDALRAAPDAAELQRRLTPQLDARQRQHLHEYGYPHVLDRWQFHMTLSDTLPPGPDASREALATQARAHFAAALAQPLRCDALCVFAEAAPGAPLLLTHRFALRG